MEKDSLDCLLIISDVKTITVSFRTKKEGDFSGPVFLKVCNTKLLAFGYPFRNRMWKRWLVRQSDRHARTRAT